MPLVLQSYRQEKVKEETKVILLRSVEFPQSPETLERILRHITNSVINRYLLEKIVAYADLKLLKQFGGKARLSYSSLIKILNQRRKLAETETNKLWDELWEHSESGTVEENSDFNFEYGRLIIKELVLRDDILINSIMEKLQEKCPYSNYNDIYLCRLIGEMKLHEGIPFLLQSLRTGIDILNEEAVEALSRVGTEDVVNTLRNCFLYETNTFRLYAAGVFGNIKVPASEKAVIELLPQEKDILIKTSFAYGLCRLLSLNGIPLVRELINGENNVPMQELVEDLYVNCVINCVTF